MYAMRQFAVDNSTPTSKVTSADVLEMLGAIEAGSVGSGRRNHRRRQRARLGSIDSDTGVP